MNKTILAVDDDESMLKFYKVALAEFGEVRIAKNLTDARKQLDGIDLIILDFNLEHDQELFQDVVPELLRVAPVLLCSGVDDVRVPSLGASLGIAGYWNKSSGREKLCSLIRSILNSRSASR